MGRLASVVVVVGCMEQPWMFGAKPHSLIAVDRPLMVAPKQVAADYDFGGPKTP